MFSYMYDLNIANKYDISCRGMGPMGGNLAQATGSMGQTGSRSSAGSRDLRRSKSVHLMEVVQERRPRSHRFWRERCLIGDVNAGHYLIDLEGALPRTNNSAWSLSFDGEDNLNSVRSLRIKANQL
jgi:hypothetical protein